VRRIWRFVVDLLDGIFASVLYGGQGGLTYTTEETTADFDERIRRYRDRVKDRGESG